MFIEIREAKMGWQWFIYQDNRAEIARSKAFLTPAECAGDLWYKKNQLNWLRTDEGQPEKEPYDKEL